MNEAVVIFADGVADLFPLDAGSLERYAVNVLDSCAGDKSEVNINFIDNTYSAELNERYRDKKGPTDVLSFSLSEKDADKLEGEVYVSLEKAKSQAEEIGIPFAEEVVRLVTHGLLHLAGRVHDDDESYNSMVRETEAFVGKYFIDYEADT